MNSSNPVQKHDSCTLLFLFSFWFSAVCYGWSLEPFCDQLILDKYSIAGNWALFGLTQTATTCFTLLGCLFYFGAMFEPLGWWRRSLLLIFGNFVAILLILLGLGLAGEPLLGKLFFQFKITHGNGLYNFPSRIGWTSPAIVLISSLVASGLLSTPFYRIRFLSGRKTNKTFQTKTPARVRSFAQAALYVLIASVLVLVVRPAFVSGSYWLSLVAIGWLLSFLFAFGSTTLALVSTWWRIAAVAISWLLVIGCIIPFSSDVVQRYGSHFLLDYWSTVSIYFAVFAILASACALLGIRPTLLTPINVRKKSRTKEETDPLAEEEPARPVELNRDAVSQADSSHHKGKEIRVTFSRMQVVSMLAISAALSIVAAATPRIISPYIYLAIGEYQLATITASIKNANGGSPFVESHISQFRCSDEKFIEPILSFDLVSKQSSLFSANEINIQLDPLGQKRIANLLGKLPASKNPRFVFHYQCSTFTPKPTQIELFRHTQLSPRLIDFSELPPKKQFDLLKTIKGNPVAGCPTQIRNALITSDMIPFFERWNAYFEGCRFEKNFDFTKLFATKERVRFYENCKLDFDQWLEIVIASPKRCFRGIVVKGNKTQVPNFVLEIVENTLPGNSWTPGSLLLYKLNDSSHPRKPVDRWNFSIKKNIALQNPYRSPTTITRIQNKKTFDRDLDCNLLTIEKGKITGICYRCQLSHPQQSLDSAKGIRWLSLPPQFLFLKLDWLKIYQEKMPDLQHLDIDFDHSHYFTQPGKYDDKTFSNSLAEICKSPKLEVLQISGPTKKNIAWLNSCSAPTLMFRDPESNSYDNWLAACPKNSRLRNVVFNDPNFPRLQVSADRKSVV